MEEAEFFVEAEAELSRLEYAIEAAASHAGIDLEIDVLPGGGLQLVFENASQIIINMHGVAREIWVAARSGGFHFRKVDNHWFSARDGLELWQVLATSISLQSGEIVCLSK